MRNGRIAVCIALTAATVATAPALGQTTRQQTAQGAKGMVVTGHPMATDAAARVLAEGGNAIDAAVAAALMLGVVDGHNSGIGGGCFMLIRTADGQTVALDGREMAPAAATRDMFIRDGKADTRLAQTGALASGVPGSLLVYQHALEKYGKKQLADLLEPAAKVAEEGFFINRSYARKLRDGATEIAQFPASRAILLRPDGSPWAEGNVLRQPDLAKSYRAIAQQGTSWFYEGDFARAVGQWMQANGGILTADDFARYEMKQREPLVTKYRRFTVIGFPPPSSGGVHVAQILGMLERFDLAAMEKKSPAARLHVMAEAMKLAFADRAHWLGDPDHAAVPRGLIDPEYVKQLAAKIDPQRVIAAKSHGQPPRAAEDLFGQKHTTHIAAADAQGNWVALTATVNTGFGSKVIVPGTGIILNNQMDDFAIQPGVPNHFKLIGAEANAVAPGKRPLSSMSPTIVLKDGRPVMTLGAAGGPTIITQVVLAISNHLDLGDDLAAALKRPRIHHQWRPDKLRVEKSVSDAVIGGLEEMGHPVEPVAPFGATNATAQPEANGALLGASDPRGEGKAAGH
ncbi:MAG TPA: gamma-glutamyltransferase [Tepidisphaeraceae bacterium]|nr:gamma-glutamyltransferase [Tepidisphaeraceae bacterium]